MPNTDTNAQWVSKLKEGSQVAYGHYYFGRPVFSFSKVTYISPKRSVIKLASGNRFNKYGDECGVNVDELHRKWLCEPEEAQRMMDAHKAEDSLKAKEKQ